MSKKTKVWAGPMWVADENQVYYLRTDGNQSQADFFLAVKKNSSSEPILAGRCFTDYLYPTKAKFGFTGGDLGKKMKVFLEIDDIKFQGKEGKIPLDIGYNILFFTYNSKVLEIIAITPIDPYGQVKRFKIVYTERDRWISDISLIMNAFGLNLLEILKEGSQHNGQKEEKSE